MNYIGGYVFAVHEAKRAAFLQSAELRALALKKLGALRVVECWGDDVPQGTLTSFPIAVKCEPDEVVVFSWVEWPSKQAHEEGMKKLMADTYLEHQEMPFDGKRMIYGGFQMIMEK
jgi:uncharacterized protein YbaA (DUF1428 family)